MHTKHYFNRGFIFLILFMPLKLHASTLYPVMDRHLVKEAELIFAGHVTAIQYKSSTAIGRGSLPVPHTFVTCSINQVFKGKSSAGKTITLRMEGGPEENDPTHVLEVEGVPVFRVGDEGVFFVRRNGTQMCPLVGWQQGFIRIYEGAVYTYEGHELLLSEDPLYAARLHPLDIRDFSRLSQSLLSPKRSLDQLVLSDLSEECRALMRDPGNLELIKTFDPQRLIYDIPTERIRELGVMSRLIPYEVRSIPRNYNQLLMYRDLNILLAKRNLFSPDAVNSALTVRTATAKLLALDQNKISIENLLLLNRRVLEDMYPTLLTKSLDQTILAGANKNLPFAHSQIIAGQEIRTAAANLSPYETPPAAQIPFGAVLDTSKYLSHLQAMVTELHTREELSGLAEVLSQNIDLPFQAQVMQEATPDTPAQ